MPYSYTGNTVLPHQTKGRPVPPSDRNAEHSIDGELACHSDAYLSQLRGISSPICGCLGGVQRGDYAVSVSLSSTH